MQIIKTLDKLETHDRLDHLIQDQSANIFQGAEECLKKNELSLVLQQYSPYFYMFAHPRTADDGITKRLLWQPRLTKPTAQTNSYLFRAKSHTDEIEVCWILPPREIWSQFDEGQLTESEDVRWSIDMFVNHRKILEESHPEDLSDGEIKHIYKQVKDHYERNKLGMKLILPEWFV